MSYIKRMMEDGYGVTEEDKAIISEIQRVGVRGYYLAHSTKKTESIKCKPKECTKVNQLSLFGGENEKK